MNSVSWEFFMKRIKFYAEKSILVFLSAATAAISMTFAGCSGKTDYALYAVNEDGKITANAGMTEGMFSYFLSQHKGQYYAVLRYNDSSISSDSPEIWTKTAPDGETYEKKFFDDTVDEAKALCAANAILYSMPSAENPKKNYSLPEDYIDYVDALVRQNAINSYGSVMAFESYLKNYGATLEDYTDLYIMTANIDLLKEALFNDETGSMRISEEDKKQYYAENYYSVKHIFVNSSYDEKIDGTRSPLSHAESQKRIAAAEEIYKFINDGGSFEQAKQSFTQSYVTVYDGVSAMDISSETPNAPELGEALKNMELGELRKVDSEYGIHIIQRVETAAENYNANETVASSINSRLSNLRYEELIKQYTDNININYDIVGNYTISAAVLP